jgi:hypothetical protein
MQLSHIQTLKIRRSVMRIPQIIMGIGLVLLVVLLFTSPRHRAPAYSAWNEVTVQGTVEGVQEFYCL